CCNPARRASAADCGQSCMPLGSKLNPGSRLADCTMLPAQNKAGPEVETLVGKGVPPLRVWMTSAGLAPHPVPPELERTPLCIWCIESACENKLVGTGTD